MDWYSGYNKRRKLTIPASRAVGDLSDFPVMVKISDSAGINNADLSDILSTNYRQLFYDDCSGSFESSWTDKSCDLGTAYFENNYLTLATHPGSGYSGANALTNEWWSTAGALSISFDWLPVPGGQWWDDNFTDAELDIKIVNTNPLYASANWSYCRCERSIGANTFLALSLRSSLSNNISIRQNLQGSLSTLKTVGFVHGTSHNVIWTIDFNNFMTHVTIDGVDYITDLSWNSDVADTIGSYFKFNFHWHNYKTSLPQRFTSISVQGLSVGLLKDVTLTDINNNPLYSEVTYNYSTAQKGVLWTKLPTITSGVDNSFYLYYDEVAHFPHDYTDVTGTSIAAKVWDNNFTAVYHLCQSVTDTILDSTSSGYDCVAHNMNSSGSFVEGLVDKSLYFDGDNDYLRTITTHDWSALESEFTLEAVAKWHPTASWESIISIGPVAAGQIELKRYATYSHLSTGLRGDDVQSNISISVNQYAYYGIRFNGALQCFKNNVMDTITNTATPSDLSSSYLFIAYAGQTYNNQFEGTLDELRVSKVHRSESWLKTTNHTMFDDLITYSDVEEFPGFEPKYRNIWVTDEYVFNCTVSGIAVYDSGATWLGHIEVPERASSVWSDNDFLYIGTTSSGILKHSLTSISGSVFNDVSVYKQYPDITSNGVNYIHGAGGYICATTVSGVDQIHITSDTRIHTTISGMSLSTTVGKCFQMSTGGLYYITHHKVRDVQYDARYYKRVCFSESLTQENYQVLLTFGSGEFDFDHTNPKGTDIRFFDENLQKVPYYIERWSPLLVKIWLTPPVGSTYVYMVYGNEDELVTESDPESVFLLYDNFSSSTLDTNKWTVVGNPSDFYIDDGTLISKSRDGSYLLSSGTLNIPIIIEQDLYKTHGSTDSINYVNTLLPNEDGVRWYKGSKIAREVLFNSSATWRPTLSTFANNYAYRLTTTIAQNRITMEVVKDGTAYLSDSWSGVTAGGMDRKLKLFGGVSSDSSFRVYLYWIRVRRYDPRGAYVSHLDKEQLLYYSTVNVLYTNNSDWTDDTVDYKYNGTSEYFPTEVQINDLFISEGTTTSGNTIFLATNEGALVIEEVRGDETSANKYCYKLG